MRAGILSVARKALDGCSLMNTLAAQVAADLGYATEAGRAGKTTFFFFENWKGTVLKGHPLIFQPAIFRVYSLVFRGGSFFCNRGWFRDVSWCVKSSSGENCDTNKKVRKRSKWWRESRISFRDLVKIISLEIWGRYSFVNLSVVFGHPNTPDIGIIIPQHTSTPLPWKSTGGDDF